MIKYLSLCKYIIVKVEMCGIDDSSFDMVSKKKVWDVLEKLVLSIMWILVVESNCISDVGVCGMRKEKFPVLSYLDISRSNYIVGNNKVQDNGFQHIIK